MTRCVVAGWEVFCLVRRRSDNVFGVRRAKLIRRGWFRRVYTIRTNCARVIRQRNTYMYHGVCFISLMIATPFLSAGSRRLFARTRREEETAHRLRVRTTPPRGAMFPRITVVSRRSRALQTPIRQKQDPSFVLCPGKKTRVSTSSSRARHPERTRCAGRHPRCAVQIRRPGQSQQPHRPPLQMAVATPTPTRLCTLHGTRARPPRTRTTTTRATRSPSRWTARARFAPVACRTQCRACRSRRHADGCPRPTLSCHARRRARPRIQEW